MRVFETDAQREFREREEAERRRNRDAAVNARQRADAVEAEREREWRRVQAEGQRQQQWPSHKLDNSPDAVAARAAATNTAGQLEQERRRRHDAFRQQVAQEAIGTRNARDAAITGCDIDGFVAAHSRFVALEALMNELDNAEHTRRSLGATPFMHGAARL